MSNKNRDFTFLQRVELETLWIICRLIAILPHFVRHYIIGGIVYLFIAYIIRYRRKVIMHNLRNSFPEKSEKQLRDICLKSYKNLTDELRRRMTFSNAEPTMKAVEGESAVFMTAHYGPWESGSIVSLKFVDHTFVAVYHELSNKVIDELFKRIRQHTNVELVSMSRLMRHFIDNRNKRPMILGLIADQNPTIRPNFHWYKFLHQWTAFYEGAEVLALKYSLPVYYFSPRRLKSGYYEGTFTMIYDGKEQVEPHTITDRYARLLEADINRHPEMWIWSHRRWKHTPPAELQAQKF